MSTSLESKVFNVAGVPKACLLTSKTRMRWL